MKNGYIKTAAATPYITVADCNANGNEIIRLIHEMEKEHVKVMTFPELCITGYTCQDLFLQRRLLDSAWETLLKITKETADVDALVFVGVPFRNHGKLYNVAAVLNRGEIIGLVPKTYLPNYGEFYSIYWSEYKLVKESGSSELREMPDYLNQDRPSFEARA